MESERSQLSAIDRSLTQPYRHEIDGLRAVAISAVILNHFNQGLLPSGYLGVDIFFVISGYVISGSILNLNARDLADFLAHFYEKRIKRLTPALALCVAITSILVCLLNPSPDVSLKTGITSMVGFSNLYLLYTSTDYFAQSSGSNAFMHTWSLGVEEQFYLVFPILLWAMSRGRPSSYMKGSIPVVAIGTLSLLSLASWIWVGESAPKTAFYLMPTRFWELGTGCLVYLVTERISKRARRRRIISPTTVLLLLLACLFTHSSHPTYLTIAAVILSAVLIATLKEESAASYVLTRTPVMYIGLISYSLYLWHWGILVISRWTIGAHLWSVPLQLALMFLFATSSYHFIEKPLRRSVWSDLKLRSITYGLSTSLAVCIFCFILRTPVHAAIFLGRNPPTDDSQQPDGVPFEAYQRAIANAKPLLSSCNMTPHHRSGSAYKPKPIVDSKFVDACIRNVSSRRKILLVGDSFAEVSARPVAAIAESLGYEFRMIFGYACPYPFQFRTIKSAASSRCAEVDEQLLVREIVESLAGGDLLVVRLYLPKQEYLVYPQGRLPPVDAYDEAIASLAGAVASKGAKLLLIGANPTLTDQQTLLLTSQWYQLPTNNEVPPQQNPETLYYHALEDHLQQTMPAQRMSYFFSLRPYLCDIYNICWIQHDSIPLYADAQHLSVHARNMFFQDLLAYVVKITSGTQEALTALPSRDPPSTNRTLPRLP